MKKKMVIGLIISIFVIVGISIASAVNTTAKKEEKQLNKIDSPLFNIRTQKILQNKDSKTNYQKGIFTNFLRMLKEERTIYIPELIKNIFGDENYYDDTVSAALTHLSCPPQCCKNNLKPQE